MQWKQKLSVTGICQSVGYIYICIAAIEQLFLERGVGSRKSDYMCPWQGPDCDGLMTGSENLRNQKRFTDGELVNCCQNYGFDPSKELKAACSLCVAADQSRCPWWPLPTAKWGLQWASELYYEAPEEGHVFLKNLMFFSTCSVLPGEPKGTIRGGQASIQVDVILTVSRSWSSKSCIQDHVPCHTAKLYQQQFADLDKDFKVLISKFSGFSNLLHALDS